jgi:phosphohistidine swiveling domain-containing protein
MKLTLNFKELSKQNTDIAGGKGASLGEMTQVGIPVPPGFVVLSTTFETFIKEADLVQEIDAVIDGVNHKDINSVETASEKIQALIKNASVPENIAKEIEEQFKLLDTEYVAVRSSATAEDGADNAWAGQLDSYLNTKKEDLLEKVQHCWASLFTPRAIFYRFEKGLHTTKISVAVVVQKMVNSEVSGIAFSVHPVTEDRNQMIIEAGFGLGEAIVSGSVTPDSYVVEKEPRRIIDINVSSQTRALYRVETGGNEWLDIPEPKASSQVLTEAQISEFADLIMKIENHYGFPCDIEWAFEKGKFYIVQSRPITTLRNKPVENNFSEKYILANQDIDISWTNLGVIWDGMLDERIKEQLGIPFPKSFCEMKKGKTINLYVEATGLKEFIDISAKKVINDKLLLESLKEKTIEVTREMRDYADKLLRDINTISVSEILNILPKIKKMQAESMVYGCVVAFADAFGEISNKTTEILNKRTSLKYPTHIYTAVLSFKDKTLTQKAYEDIATSKLSDEELISKYYWLDQGYIGRGLAIDKLKEIKEHKISLDNLPSNDELLMELMLSDEEKRYFEVSSDLILIKSLRADSRQYLNVVVSKLIDKIAKDLNMEVKFLEVLCIDDLCNFLRGDKDAIFNLNERYQHSIILGIGPSNYNIIIGGEVDVFLKNRIESNTPEKKEEIKGQVANPGKVIGVVKLVFGPQHISKVNEGDIMISTATSPQLLPAMKKAAAFVTDIGGITSHAAIVSRELKKPCIVGTKIATQILKDGDMIEVDADKGIVRIIK